MRYSELYLLPGTPQEAKNVVLDILAVYQAVGKDEVPLDIILKTLHKQNFDIDRRMLIDLIKNQSPIDRISDGVVYIKTTEPEDLEDIEATSDTEEEKSRKKVEKMAKKALKSDNKLSESLRYKRMISALTDEQEILDKIETNPQAILYINEPSPAAQKLAIKKDINLLFHMDNVSDQVWDDTLIKKAAIKSILNDLSSKFDFGIIDAKLGFKSLKEKNCPWPELDVIEQKISEKKGD